MATETNPPPQQLTTEDGLAELMTVTEPDEVAYEDWIDEDTGEVLWCAKERADQCRLHPVYIARRDEALRARCEWTAKLWDDPLGLLNELIDRYVKDHADPNMLLELGVEPSCDVFFDLAEAFFFEVPKWKEVVEYVNDEPYREDDPMSKHDVQIMVAEQLHHACQAQEG